MRTFIAYFSYMIILSLVNFNYDPASAIPGPSLHDIRWDLQVGIATSQCFAFNVSSIIILLLCILKINLLANSSPKFLQQYNHSRLHDPPLSEMLNCSKEIRGILSSVCHLLEIKELAAKLDDEFHALFEQVVLDSCNWVSILTMCFSFV